MSRCTLRTCRLIKPPGIVPNKTNYTTVYIMYIATTGISIIRVYVRVASGALWNPCRGGDVVAGHTTRMIAHHNHTLTKHPMDNMFCFVFLLSLHKPFIVFHASNPDPQVGSGCFQSLTGWVLGWVGSGQMSTTHFFRWSGRGDPDPDPTRPDPTRSDTTPPDPT